MSEEKREEYWVEIDVNALSEFMAIQEFSEQKIPDSELYQTTLEGRKGGLVVERDLVPKHVHSFFNFLELWRELILRFKKK